EGGGAKRPRRANGASAGGNRSRLPRLPDEAGGPRRHREPHPAAAAPRSALPGPPSRLGVQTAIRLHRVGASRRRPACPCGTSIAAALNPPVTRTLFGVFRV